MQTHVNTNFTSPVMVLSSSQPFPSTDPLVLATICSALLHHPWDHGVEYVDSHEGCTQNENLQVSNYLKLFPDPTSHCTGSHFTLHRIPLHTAPDPTSHCTGFHFTLHRIPLHTAPDCPPVCGVSTNLVKVPSEGRVAINTERDRVGTILCVGHPIPYQGWKKSNILSLT